MFKSLRDKLKGAISKLSKDVEETTEDVVIEEPVEEPSEEITEDVVDEKSEEDYSEKTTEELEEKVKELGGQELDETEEIEEPKKKGFFGKIKNKLSSKKDKESDKNEDIDIEIDEAKAEYKGAKTIEEKIDDDEKIEDLEEEKEKEDLESLEEEDKKFDEEIDNEILEEEILDEDEDKLEAEIEKRKKTEKLDNETDLVELTPEEVEYELEKDREKEGEPSEEEFFDSKFDIKEDVKGDVLAELKNTIKEEEALEETIEKREKTKEELKEALSPKKKSKKKEKTPEVKEEPKEEVVEETPEAESVTQEGTSEEEIEEPKKKGFFGKIKETITKKSLSDSEFENIFFDLEIILLENNVALEVIEKIKEDLRKELVLTKVLRGKVKDIITETLRNSVSEILDIETFDLLDKCKEKKPLVICMVGINGTGKTTSSAKLANMFLKNDKTVVLAAADTFRAAAIQQLEEHAKNLNIKIIKHDYGSDAAAVGFDAVKYAEAKGIDVVIVDTAGRQHSNSNLMDELRKLIRVVKPDLKIFVGDALTGNDCVEQATKFDEAVSIDANILTKVDADEKGGASISVSYVTKKPIIYIGVGQGYDDIEKFNPKEMLEKLGL